MNGLRAGILVLVVGVSLARAGVLPFPVPVANQDQALEIIGTDGALAAVPSGMDSGSLVLSPNKRRLAFTARDGNIRIMDVQTLKVATVTTTGELPGSRWTGPKNKAVCWLPDSTSLVYRTAPDDAPWCEEPPPPPKPGIKYGYFLWQGPGRPATIVLGLSQAGKREIIGAVGSAHDVLVQETFLKRPQQGAYRLHALDVRSLDMRAIREFEVGEWPSEFQPSPDGGMLVYTAGSTSRGGWGENYSQIRLFMLEKHREYAVTIRGAWADFQRARFSPNGRQIAYERCVGLERPGVPKQEIWVCSRFGHAHRQVTSGWSFMWVRPDLLIVERNEGLVLVSLNGKEPRQLTGPGYSLPES